MNFYNFNNENRINIFYKNFRFLQKTYSEKI